MSASRAGQANLEDIHSHPDQVVPLPSRSNSHGGSSSGSNTHYHRSHEEPSNKNAPCILITSSKHKHSRAGFNSLFQRRSEQTTDNLAMWDDTQSRALNVRTSASPTWSSVISRQSWAASRGLSVNTGACRKRQLDCPSSLSITHRMLVCYGMYSITDLGGESHKGEEPSGAAWEFEQHAQASARKRRGENATLCSKT